MKYSEESLKNIKEGYQNNRKLLTKLKEKIIFFEINIKNKTAREYLMHGVKRRIDILDNCIEKIFNEFPPDTDKLLGIYKIYDINIYLHAFLINVYGITENLALFIAFEKNILNSENINKKERNKIGLFKKSFQEKLPTVLKNYFSKEKINTWYNEYAKNYRDALAHRIPPFIPPNEVNEEEAEEWRRLDKEMANFNHKERNYREFSEMFHKMQTMGSPAMYFFHSISEESRRVILHGQILCDLITLKEMIFVVLDNINN